MKRSNLRVAGKKVEKGLLSPLSAINGKSHQVIEKKSRQTEIKSEKKSSSRCELYEKVLIQKSLMLVSHNMVLDFSKKTYDDHEVNNNLIVLN